MENQRDVRSKVVHILVVPFPGQGHINSILHFTKRLVSYGLKATLATTIFISKSINPNPSPLIQIDTISDGYDEGGADAAQAEDFGAYNARLEAYGSKTLAELIARHEHVDNSNPIGCIIYDAFMPWALDVAKGFGLAGAAFFTQACTVNYLFYCVHHGLLKIPITCSSFPIHVPGLHRLRLQDMPPYVSMADAQHPTYQEFSNLHNADFLLVNTVYELEQEAVESMSKVCPMLTIGPTIPSFFTDKRIEGDKEYGMNLFASDQSSIAITNWLNNKPQASVVYVSFGSWAYLSANQMEELALGLKATDFYFLWVVRSSEEAKLPHKFKQETIEKGLVVKWAPQVEILSHMAVGCFFTHCGWNSTVEALSLGVPMVAMPQWTDHPTDAKLVEDLWKVGVRVKVDENGIVGRQEVEFCIRKVMEGDTAREIKKNAKKWSNVVLEAISEDGSSKKNIDEFVSKLKMIISPTSLHLE